MTIKNTLGKVLGGLLLSVLMVLPINGAAQVITGYDQFGNPIYGNNYNYGYNYGSVGNQILGYDQFGNPIYGNNYNNNYYNNNYYGNQITGYDQFGNPIYGNNYNNSYYSYNYNNNNNQALINQLQQQISNLMAQINAASVNRGVVLGATTASNLAECSFTRDLTIGSTGTDVRVMQRLIGTAETGTFDSATRNAVINFQSLHSAEILAPRGLTVPTGTVGSMTRSKLNRMCNEQYGTVLGVNTFNTYNPTYYSTPVISTPIITNNFLMPTVSFYAEPNPATSGQEITLIWRSQNTTSCSASGAWGGNIPTSGARLMGRIRHNTTYTIRCIGTNGAVVNQNVEVQIGSTANRIPTLSFFANPSVIEFGDRTNLSWNSDNANNCTASGAWSGSKGTSGSFETDPLTGSRTYTLECRNTTSGNTVVQSVTVNVF